MSEPDDAMTQSLRRGPLAALPGCANCGHPAHLHANNMCGIALCYCGEFVTAYESDEPTDEQIANGFNREGGIPYLIESSDF